MDKWIQLPTFVRLVAEFQAKMGMTQAQVAKELDVSVSTLRNWLYGSKVPGFKKKQKAAVLFGCDVTEFIDSTMLPRPTSIDLRAYSEIDRYRFDQIIHTLGDERLSDKDRQILFEEFKARVTNTLNLKFSKD